MEKIIFSVLRYIHDCDEAKDIASDIILFILQNADKIGVVENPNSWICSVSKHYAINFIRKDSKILKTDKLYASTSCPPNMELCDELTESIQRLSELEQTLLELQFVYGYKNKELSKMLKTPVVTKKRQVYTIKAKLKNLKKFL